MAHAPGSLRCARLRRSAATSRESIARRLATLGALATLALTAGCASTSHGLPDLPACYYFEQDSVAEALRLPWGVRLEASALEGWPSLDARQEVREVTTLTGLREQDHPFGYWIQTAADSVEVGYPGGGALLLELRVVDRDLAGVVRELGDALKPDDDALGPRPSSPRSGTHSVRLSWARCP